MRHPILRLLGSLLLMGPLSLMGLLSACSPKEVPRVVHDGASPATSSTTAKTVQDNDSAVDKVGKVYSTRAQLQAQVADPQATNQALLKIVSDLSPFILDPEFLENRATRSSDQLHTLLELFDQALMRVIDSDPTLVDSTDLLDRYSRAIFSDCSGELKECFALSFFTSDHHFTPAIFLHMAQRLDPQITELRRQKNELEAATNAGQTGASIKLTDVSQRYNATVELYYRYLYAGVYEGKNGPRLTTPDILYVRHAGDYFASFNSLPATEKRRMQNLSYYKRRHEILQTILYDLSAQGAKSRSGHSDKEYCDFVIDLKPFSLIENGGSFDKVGLNEFVKDFVSCASNRSRLEPIMAEYVQSERERSVKEFSINPKAKPASSNYFYAYQDLAATPFFMHSLGVENKAKDDLSFYIIDRLFYEDIDLQTAITYWHNGKVADDLTFLAFVQNYLKVQVAEQIKTSALIFADELKSRTQNGKGLTTDLFSDTVDAVNAKVHFDWQILKTRVGFIKTFLIQALDDKYNQRLLSSHDQAAANTYRRLKSQLESLSDHLNYVATAPLMLPLTYYMAKATGSIEFVVPWWSATSDQNFKMDASQALGSFFNGTSNLSQVFNYGDQAFGFSETERLHVLDMAFRTGIFEFVPFDLVPDVTRTRTRLTGSASINNELLLFQQYFDDTMKVYRNDFARAISDLDNLEQGTNLRERFLGACRDPLSAPVSLSLNDFTMHTLSQDKDLMQPVSALYDSTGFLQAWSFAKHKSEIMISILHNYLYGENAEQRLPPEKFKRRDEIMRAVQDEFEQYLRHEREYYRKLFALDKQIVSPTRDCLATIYRADSFRRDHLIRINIDFYKDVHAAMTVLNLAGQLNSNASAGNAVAPIEAQLAPLIDGWNADANSRTDVIARMKRLVAQATTAPMWSQTGNGDLRSRLESAFNDLLGIHNYDQAPFVRRNSNGEIISEVGFFITGIGTWPKENKIKRVNSLTSSRFVQGKWDSVIRLRRQMQTTRVLIAEANAAIGLNLPSSSSSDTMPLAANVDIPLGSTGELENDMQFYGSQLRGMVDYNSDQTRFVRDAMIQLSGYPPGGNQYFSWYSSSGQDDSISPLQHRLNFLISFLKDNQELSTAAVCPKDIWNQPIPDSGNSDCQVMNLQAKDVIQYFLSWNDLLNVSPSDQELLNWMDRPTKLGETAKYYYQYHEPSSTREWTYLDQFYRSHFTSLSNSSGGLSEHLDAEELFSDLIDVERTRLRDDQHLFSLDPTVTQLARNEIRGRIARHITVVQQFEQAARQIEDEAVKNPTRALPEVIIEKEKSQQLRDDESYKPGNWRYMGITLRSAGPRAGTPIYLRDDADSAQAWFRGYVKSFYVKTSECHALPHAGDPDYDSVDQVIEANKDSDCETRFYKWWDLVHPGGN